MYYNDLIARDVNNHVMSDFEYPGYYRPKLFGVQLKYLLRIVYEEYHI